LIALKGNAEIGDILGVTTWGPCSYQERHAGSFSSTPSTASNRSSRSWAPVARPSREPKVRITDQVTGVWKDGRVGTYRGIVKGKSEFGAMVYGSKGNQMGAKAISYEALCRQIGTILPHRHSRP
jgi:hypothetical protein